MLEALLYPETIAVVGASRNRKKVGHAIVANLINGGYQGTIIPINPNADSIENLPCLAFPGQDGRSIDLAIIAVPRDQAFEAVRQSIDGGAKALIIVTAGFKETDYRGLELEQSITGYCTARNVRLLGPNCLGVLNADNNMNAAFAGSLYEKGNISIVSQSGALCAAMLDIAETRHLGLAKVLSIGNKADITEADILMTLALDEETRVIIAYLEDICSGDDFIKAAAEASNRKPVILFKAGVTKAGQQAASSHTGVRPCTEMAYGAAFKRSGVIQAQSFDDLFDFAIAMAKQPIPRGNRVLIITNAGGPGTMAADAVEKAGLQVAQLSLPTIKSLQLKLPDIAGTNNPIDVLGDAPPERYIATLKAAENDENVDAVIVILTPQAMTHPTETAQAIAAHCHGTKPILAAFMGGKKVLTGREKLRQAGLPYYSSPEKAVSALKAMCEYNSWKNRPTRVITRFKVHRRRVERIITRHLRTDRHQVSELKSKSILQAYGFQIPEGHLATNEEEAIQIAELIGYPVAMKIVSTDIIHKSDLGGVRLNISNNDMVSDAFDIMTLRIGQRAPGAQIEGIYVEKMVGRGMEVIIGMNRDPHFGPMLMFGLGGIFVETMENVTFHLAPITEDEALQMLKSTRSYQILQGKRGQKGLDLAAIANGLQRISQLTTDFPQIAELDITPYIVGEMGTGAFVTDARITLKETECA